MCVEIDPRNEDEIERKDERNFVRFFVLTVKIINANSEFVFSSVDGFGDSLVILAVKSHVGVGRLVPVTNRKQTKRRGIRNHINNRSLAFRYN